MSDETSGIIWWRIEKQYQERVERDEALIYELRQSTKHWRDTAWMLKRQRNTAEEQRDGWKERALKSEQQRQSLAERDLLIIAEGQRDQAKIDAEHWKGEWAVVMGQLGGARAEVEALRKDAARYRLMRGLFRYAKWDDVDALHELKPDDEKYIADDLLDAALDCALTAAMAVQP